MIFDGLTQNISRIELTPDEPVNRLNDRRYLDVYYQDGEGYHKLDPEDWEFSLDGPTGRITIAFPDLLTAYEVRIHCRYDDRDADYQPINASEFNNLAQSMVKVYRVYDYRNESYAYDANGNRLSETITTLYPKTFDYNYYNNSDRLKTRISTDGAMKWAFVYDNNGNLVKKGNTFTSFGETVDYTVEGEGVIYWEYDYDVFNRLTAVRKNGAETSRYVYDPVGLRIYKDGTKDVLYDYDLGGNIICETDLGTGEVRSYVWVNGKHLARVDGVIGGAGEKYFYECDHLGLPMVVMDEDGEPVWRGDFTPFGERIEGEWAFVDTHGFTGKDWDEDAGLYYFNARWYDSDIGRFVSEDPIQDELNWYQYAYNNPLKYNDPDGQKPYISIEEETIHGKKVQYYGYLGVNRSIELYKIIAGLVPGVSIFSDLAERHLIKVKPLEKENIIKTIRNNANKISQYVSLLDIISEEVAIHGGKLIRTAKSIGKIAGYVGYVLSIWDTCDWFKNVKSDQIDELISFFIKYSSTEEGILLKYDYLHKRLGELIESGQIKLVTNIFGDVSYATIENIPHELFMQLRHEMMLLDALRVVSGEETEDVYRLNYRWFLDDALEILESVQEAKKIQDEQIDTQ